MSRVVKGTFGKKVVRNCEKIGDLYFTKGDDNVEITAAW